MQEQRTAVGPRPTEYAGIILDSLETPLWIFDLDKLRKVWANPAGLSFWSASSLEELQSRDFSRDITLATIDKHQAYRQVFAEQGSVAIRECWTFYPGGKPETIYVKIRPIELNDGALGIICELEQKVRVAPENIRAVDALTHSLAMVATYAANGTLLFANPAARRSFPAGHQTLKDRFPHSETFEAILAAVTSGRRYQGEVEVKTGAGRNWHHVSAEQRHDPVTGEMGILVSEMDITRARAAQQLAERARNEVSVAQSRLWACIEELPDGIIMLDQDDRLVACNKKYRDMLPGAQSVLVAGATFEEITKASIANGDFPIAIGQEEEWLRRRVLQHRFPSVPVDIQTRDGRHLLVTECRTAEGEHFGIYVDFTEHISTKAQIDSLAQRLKLARLDAERQNQITTQYAEKAFLAQSQLNATMQELHESRDREAGAVAERDACLTALEQANDQLKARLGEMVDLLRQIGGQTPPEAAQLVERAGATVEALESSINAAVAESRHQRRA